MSIFVTFSTFPKLCPQSIDLSLSGAENDGDVLGTLYATAQSDVHAIGALAWQRLGAFAMHNTSIAIFAGKSH